MLKDAAILLCTALGTDICKIKMIGEATEYQVTKGVTLLTLDKNGKTEKLKLSKAADVLINEKACADYLEDDMNPSCGEVCLIDNNNDGEYDAIKVVSYENYVISRIDTNSGIIYSKNRTDTLVLDEDDRNLMVCVDDGSVDFSISRFTADMVISVAMSADTGGKKFVRILTSDETAEGEISELDNGFENINLGGEIYPVEDSYRQQLEDENGGVLSAGRYAVFRFNVFGKIVYADINASSGKNTHF